MAQARWTGWRISGGLFVPIKALLLLLLTSGALYAGCLPWLSSGYLPHWAGVSAPMAGGFALLVVTATLLCFFGMKLYCQWVLKVRLLEQPLTGLEHWLHTTSFRLALRRQLNPPRIAVYPSRELNAFALGVGRQRATIVLSEGLVQGLKPEELEAVLAHEICHIANGDVQVLALLQGLLTVFVSLPARLLDRLVCICWPGYEQGGRFYLYGLILMQLAGGWLASLLVMHYSRQCEYRADSQAAKLVGTQKMSAALRCLNVMTASAQSWQLPAFGLSEQLKFRFTQLFNSHPSLFERLQALRANV
jgi:heat shock protein HtpX